MASAASSSRKAESTSAVGNMAPAVSTQATFAPSRDVPFASDLPAGDPRSTELPSCPPGYAPLVDLARYPSQSGALSGGSATAEAAVRALGTAGELTAVTWAKDSLVWFTSGSDHYEAVSLRDGTWFASPARFVSCKNIADVRNYHGGPPSLPNADGTKG
jgi:hypothetical protein